MTTTLANCRRELSRQIGDYWDSTTTTAGSTGKTTIIDALLKAKAVDWIDAEIGVHTLITTASDASVDDERYISTLSISAGTLTTLAHTAQIGLGVTYEVHRLFTASEKRRALIYAARAAFPAIYERIWDETLVSGNWLKDGSFEIWTGTDALDFWTKSGSTLTKISTAYLFEHGGYSCKIASAAGNINQTVTNWDDLKRLAGKTVTFTCRGWCNTASNLRISIDDGINDESFSSYHDGDSAWTRDNDPLTVTQTIDDNPTEITFKIYHALEAAATEVSYVDDARVIATGSPRLYIANLGLAEEKPVQVFVEPLKYSTQEPWVLIHNITVDYENGYLYLPSSVTSDRRLRIKGYGYLDFLASGVSSTTWAATINIENPQIDILVAQAALYLYTEMAMPNFTSGTRKDFQEMMIFWDTELRKRIGKFAMEPLSIPVRWRQ